MGEIIKKYSWFYSHARSLPYTVHYKENEEETFIAVTDTSEKADFISKACNQFDDELLEVLKEVKEVLLQLDHRHNGNCYNPLETDCNCTLCKIDKVINKATT